MDNLLCKDTKKSLFLIIRLAMAFLNLLMAGALGQETQASDHAAGHDSSMKNERKELEKEHAGEDEPEEKNHNPFINGKLLYLYSKILLITILFGFVVIFKQNIFSGVDGTMNSIPGAE